MVRLLNLSRFIVERSQVFNLRAAENNRSSAALFARDNHLYRGNCFIKDMVFKKDLKTRYIL